MAVACKEGYTIKQDIIIDKLTKLRQDTVLQIEQLIKESK